MNDTADKAADAASNSGLDLSSVIDVITSSSTDVKTIGLATLGVVVSIAAFKWIRRAIF